MKKLAQLILSVTTLVFLILAPAHAEQEIFQGGWLGKGYAINGSWKLVERYDKKFIVFNSDFSTKRGPDLKIYLSKRPIDKLRDQDVLSTSIKLSELKSNKGQQEYEIPADVNVDDYTSVVIHCEAYSHLWGGADFN